MAQTKLILKLNHFVGKADLDQQWMWNLNNVYLLFTT
jgi:hypothetical protein